MNVYYHSDLENISYPIFDRGIHKEDDNISFIVTFKEQNINLFNKYKDRLSEIPQKCNIIPNQTNNCSIDNWCDDNMINYCKDYYNNLSNGINIILTKDLQLQKRFLEIFEDGWYLYKNKFTNNFNKSTLGTLKLLYYNK